MKWLLSSLMLILALGIVSISQAEFRAQDNDGIQRRKEDKVPNTIDKDTKKKSAEFGVSDHDGVKRPNGNKSSDKNEKANNKPASSFEIHDHDGVKRPKKD